MLNNIIKITTSLVAVLLLFISLPSVAAPIDLDDITMTIMENEQGGDYVISPPKRNINWDKMLESNGITQQEYEDRYEVFIEYQSESQFEELDFFGDDINDEDMLNSTGIFEEEN